MPKRSPKKEKTFRLTSRSALGIINSLSAHITILDQNGTILATNEAWAGFAKANKIRMRPDTINVNYLEVCDRAFSDSAEIVSPLLRKLSSRCLNLTPQEIHVASFVKFGKTTEDITRKVA